MKTLLLFISAITMACSALAGDFVIFPNGITTNALFKETNCPGDYRWRAVYAKTPGNGWGWAPDTNNFSSFSASITNRTDTHIADVGHQFGGSRCGTNSLQYTNPPPDNKFRWTVFGTNNPPSSTNDLPLLLSGFLP